MGWPLQLGRTWWMGFKVLCRWCAFGIVLWMLWLPLTALVYLLGDCIGESLGLVLMLLIAPIPFYFTSKYLRLLRDEDEAAPEGEEYPRDAVVRERYPLRTKILVSMGAACLIGFLLSPPDLVSELSAGIVMAFLCGVPLSILARFAFMKSASKPVQTLVCVLVCLAAVLSTLCLCFLTRTSGR